MSDTQGKRKMELNDMEPRKFSVIGNDLLTDQVYFQLKDAILKKVLAPGQKLDIFELAEQFKVSRTPIKEAFNRLHLDGLLEIKPRKGTFVAEIKPKDIIEILDARLMFETWAAKEGIRLVTEHDLERMGKILDEMDRYYQTKPFDFLKYNDLDIAFHEYMVKLANNRRIFEMYKGLNSHWMIARGYFDIAYEKAQAGFWQHGSMLEGYRTGNLKLLLEVLTEHIADVKKGLLELYQQ
jgi:DNA-binding GntR family transcriptional regulator